MSIDDEQGTWESPIDKLQLFTDRHELTRLFAEYLNDTPSKKTILFCYGDGGNGKSLLLKFLRQRCCKRFLPSIWQQIKAKPDAEVANFIQKAINPDVFLPLPAALLDFGQPPRGENQPQDPFYGLLMLRRNLADAASELGYRLKFPLYDFACVWYLHKKGKSVEEIKRLFPLNEIVGLIVPFIDLLTKNPVGTIGKAVFDIFAKDLGEKFTLYLQQRGLKPEQVEEIHRKDPDTELIDELPRLLANDLNAAMTQDNAPPRIVLLFDTHEKFWGNQRNLPEEKFFYQDEWLRRLLRALDLELGIVVVASGREKPRWAEAPQFPIPQPYLNTRLVGHLSTADAEIYLKKAGISELALVSALVKYASVAPEEVHPFYLGLCADVVLAAAKRGTNLSAADFDSVPEIENKSRELINRLLRYVDEEVVDAIHALSACRAFDEQLYFHLGEVLHFHDTAASFRILTRFSFVWQDERRGKNWFRIHDLLRRLDYERGNEITMRSHAVLEQHYREQGDVEAIYHLNHLDREQGVQEWVEVFDRAVQMSRYEQCRNLLELRSELSIQNDFQLGNVSQSEGCYFAQLARHAEAKQEYLEAVTAYNQALKLAPDDVSVFNNQGLALQNLGDLQTQLAEHSEALQSYADAIAAYNSALNLAPDDNKALNNKGLALQGVGDLQTQLAQHSEALQSYFEAISTYNSALNLALDDSEILNNKGLALQGVGDLQTQLAQHFEALQSYFEAISTYNSALRLAPDYIYAFNNKGIALKKLGDLQTQLAQYPQALQSYTNAIAAYDSALRLAPDYIQVLNNKGNALQSLGELQAKLSQEQEAFNSWQAALAVFDRSLEIAPRYEGIRNLRDRLQEFLDNLGGGTESGSQ